MAKEIQSANFFMVSNSIFEFGFTPHTFAVYCCLLRHMSMKTRTCYPSRAEIAKLCRTSLKTVDKAIKLLCDSGLVQKQARYGLERGRDSNLYTLADLTKTAEPRAE
ncbi:MAG: helix-turn-helix domain-containing protein [Oscillospiraceae bacterium]